MKYSLEKLIEGSGFLSGLVERAFPRDGGVLIHDIESICVAPSDEEALEETLPFVGKNWVELDPLIWASYSGSITFLTKEAFHYYLPSLIIISSRDPEKCERVIEDVINLLAKMDPDRDDGWINEIWLGLSWSQLVCVGVWIVRMNEMGVNSSLPVQNAMNNVCVLAGRQFGNQV